MSNTTLRVLSSAVMVLIVVACLWAGSQYSLFLIALIGILTIDEIITNFYGQKRTGFRYLLAQISFLFSFFFLNFMQISSSSYNLFISMGIVLDILLAGYLFFINQHNNDLNHLIQKISLFTGLFILIPIICLSFIFQQERWITLFVGLLLLNFMVDTGAYFSGKYFGKRKLWEKVSPKKTVEGLVGGVISSVIVTSLYWNYMIAPVEIPLIILFAFLGVCSQVGDLLQSKLKREFEIKDSSSLIPGHGGVYDRIDSLLYVVPLYAALISYYYH